MNRSLGKKIEGTENITNFVLGGKAWFALKSLKTGTVLQYRITAAKPKENFPTTAWWVEMLGKSTDDMSSPYQYIGGLYKTNLYMPMFRVNYKLESLNSGHREYDLTQNGVKSFTWFWARLLEGNLPPSLEFYHIGRCARCGHKLTDEQSIDRGFGPTCYKMIKEQYKNI